MSKHNIVTFRTSGEARGQKTKASNNLIKKILDVIFKDTKYSQSENGSGDVNRIGVAKTESLDSTKSLQRFDAPQRLFKTTLYISSNQGNCSPVHKINNLNEIDIVTYLPNQQPI